MQVLCEKSSMGSDVRCSVCGQGFLVYWGRTPRADVSAARAVVMQALRKHHEGRTSIDGSHPGMRFAVPCWSGDAAAAGAGVGFMTGVSAYAA